MEIKNEKDKIFELRIYTVVPEFYNDLLELWEHEGKDLIAKYMNCIAIWSSESGQLNKIFHLYEWNGYKERETSRFNFYSDINSQDYVRRVKPFYQSQESYILKSLDFLTK